MKKSSPHKIFHSFSALQEATQLILIGLLFETLPPKERTLPILYRLIQYFEQGIFSLHSDGKQIWIEFVKNQDLFTMLVKQIKETPTLRSLVKLRLTEYRKMLKNSPLK